MVSRSAHHWPVHQLMIRSFIHVLRKHLMPRFDDQTVLVTGGTGGQGSSHVRAFHSEGANGVIGGIDARRGAALADELGARPRLPPPRVPGGSWWSAAVRAAESAFGALNVLVNNAGVQNPPATIEKTDQAT